MRHQHISTIVCIYILEKQEMAEKDTLSSIGHSEVGHTDSNIGDSEGDFIHRDKHANTNF